MESNKLKSQSEKLLTIKKFIKKVIYSKEDIEVVLNYSEDSGEKSWRGATAAGGVCRRPNAARRHTPLNEKTAGLENSAVRGNFLVAPTGFEPVLPA